MALEFRRVRVEGDDPAMNLLTAINSHLVDQETRDNDRIRDLNAGDAQLGMQGSEIFRYECDIQIVGGRHTSSFRTGSWIKMIQERNYGLWPKHIDVHEVEIEMQGSPEAVQVVDEYIAQPPFGILTREDRSFARYNFTLSHYEHNIGMKTNHVQQELAFQKRMQEELVPSIKSMMEQYGFPQDVSFNQLIDNDRVTGIITGMAYGETPDVRNFVSRIKGLAKSSKINVNGSTQYVARQLDQLSGPDRMALPGSAE